MKLSISDSLIRQASEHDFIYDRGRELATDGSLTHINFLKTDQLFRPYEIHATVKDHYTYEPYLILSEKHIIENYCTCYSYHTFRGMCEHLTALLFKTKELAEANNGELTWIHVAQANTERNAKRLLSQYDNLLISDSNATQSTNEVVTIMPKIRLMNDAFYLEASIGANRQYVIRDFDEFIENFEKNRITSYGKGFTYNHDTSQLDEFSKTIFQFIQRIVLDVQSYTKLTRGYAPKLKSLYLSPTRFNEFFDLFVERNIPVRLDEKAYSTLLFSTSMSSITFELSKESHGLTLKPSYDLFLLYYAQPHYYLVTDTHVLRCPSNFKKTALPLFEMILEENGHCIIPPELIPSFLSTMLPQIKSYLKPEQVHALLQDYDAYELLSNVYLDVDDDKNIVANIDFNYGIEQINPLVETNTTVIRDRLKERKTQQVFEQYQFEVVSDHYELSQQDEMFYFVSRGVNELLQESTVHATDRFKQLTYKTDTPVSVGVKLESQLMTFKLEDLMFDMSEYKDILKQYKLKKNYHRLKNGAFLELDSEYMNSFFNLVDDLGLSEKDLQQEEIRLSKYRALYLDKILDKNDIKSKKNKAFKQLVSDFEDIEQQDYEIPSTLLANLRPYQETGFKWLKTLADYELGGILADDMGLGKTLQIIALLCADVLERTDIKQSIIVTPSSLVYNWKAEFTKFAPHLRVLIVNGSSSERSEKIKTMTDYDVILTSYDLLRRDIEQYETVFRFAILDEAHYIKNQATLNAKSVKRLKADVRFALTGTPLENSIADVWSIFDFILPGYLLTYTKFKSQYETPIAKQQDTKLLARVHQLVSPFIMRRLKRDVLTELPDKLETIMYCEFSEAQRKLYEATLISMNAELQEQLGENSLNQSRIKILAMLTRLRQICCHPSLFLDDYTEESAKLNLCLELINDSIAGGHRALLFSQFTSMFDLITPHLDELNIPYFILTGSTPSEKRMELANRFNAGEVPIFLISLKAGGTGLNLTGADVVIHYDPWWNKSAENQATDRAHRLGQDNVVQVYKLIAKNTIEEKIELLQQKKQELANTLVQQGENFITALSAEDIKDLFTND